jgi:beta-glucanase (GH16 family)
VQVSAKLPDASNGLWPAIWFMPDTSTSKALEFDGHEGGEPTSGIPINQVGATGYFAPSGHQETYWNAGTDLSAGYNTFGFKYTPSNATITTYFNGNQVATNTDVQNGTMEIILQLEVAAAGDSGWHTVPTGSSPGGSMHVAEVQAYS